MIHQIFPPSVEKENITKKVQTLQGNLSNADARAVERQRMAEDAYNEALKVHQPARDLASNEIYKLEARGRNMTPGCYFQVGSEATMKKYANTTKHDHCAQLFLGPPSH